MKVNRKLEKACAVAALATAIALAFISLYITEGHEIAGNNVMAIAQFLLFTASVFGLDYKLGTFGSTRGTPESSGNKTT